MTTERTEEEKLAQAPLIVRLGGKDYEVKPLVIRDSRLWRGKLAKVLGDLPKYITVSTDDEDAFQQAMEVMIVQMPDTVADLFFEYARDLNREEIEALATEEEVATAFLEVQRYAFPLARSLLKILKQLKA